MKPPFTLVFSSTPFGFPCFPPTPTFNLPPFLTLLPQVLNSVSSKTASVFDSLPFLNQIHPFLRLPLPAQKALLFESPASVLLTANSSDIPSYRCPPRSRSRFHRTAVIRPLPTLRPDYLRTRRRKGPRDPRMKPRPLTAQRRPTPSWQPPPPQRPRSLSIGLFLFSESNFLHVSSQNPRSAGRLPAPSGASLRHVGPGRETA